MLFLFRSAPEVEKRIHSKLFRNFLEEPGYKRAGLHYCNVEKNRIDKKREKIVGTESLVKPKFAKEQSHKLLLKEQTQEL